MAEAHIPKTQPFMFSADEGVDVGMDGESPVSKDYRQGDNHFTGRIVSVTADVAPSQISAEGQRAEAETKEVAARAK